jgi:hypothetical protein
MVDLVAANRVPSNIDYASPTQFRFQIARIPNVEYFIVAANIPQVSFSGDAEINTPYKVFYNAGEVLDYDDLNVKFLVNENLENWLEIYEWINGIGFPKTKTEYSEMITASEKDPQNLFSDATMTILTNKNNPILQIKYVNAFPTALSGLDYDLQQTDVVSLSATITFKFTSIEITRL